jgi:hypothetical protein
MSAKFPRRTFAAPLVVTLAVPACFVSSGTPAPAPTTGRTSSSGGEVRDHRGESEPPRAHVNPPRPAPDGTTAHPGHEQTTPPPRQTQPGNEQMQQQTPPAPTPPAAMRSWTVFVNDKDCFTSYDVTCPPKGATCNPPPPLKLAKCPSGITADRPLKIKEDSPNACALYYPMPDCPAGVACNPPRPQKIECPTR